jgi:hypothetical protein
MACVPDFPADSVGFAVRARRRQQRAVVSIAPLIEGNVS